MAILKLLFPSTPHFLRDLKVEGNSNENGRKQQFLILEKLKWNGNGMEGNSNTHLLHIRTITPKQCLSQYLKLRLNFDNKRLSKKSKNCQT